MREIKFRAWDEETEYMYYSDKCWGGNADASFVCESEGTLKCYVPEIIEATRDESKHIVGREIGPIMHYTGLKDKNGREIDWWEDDLLQSLGADKKVGQIKYDEQCVEWRLYVDGNSWCSLAAAYYDGWKKVGNIHENPELLQKGD